MVAYTMLIKLKLIPAKIGSDTIAKRYEVSEETRGTQVLMREYVSQIEERKRGQNR